jgi:S-adenosylmethionine:tRNA ribosyltransferase-isomerase
MRASDFDFRLPSEQIAQVPCERRDGARLLVLPRAGGSASHHRVEELSALLPEESLLLLNDTRVIPARLYGHKPSGGKVELLVIERLRGDTEIEVWSCLGAASKPIRPGPLFLAGKGAPDAEVLSNASGVLEVAFTNLGPGGLLPVLEHIGAIPLPPYIERPGRETYEEDVDRYQTIYARAPGAVAAPTAGLHLTPELFHAFERRGIEHATLTLHVGPGTFAPLREDEIAADALLHSERFEVPEATAITIGRARRAGRPVIAVGTTVVRTLESVADEDGTIRPGVGRTRLFIRPGYRFRAVDGLLTNFHLPRSTLLMLVCAFAETDRVLNAYRAAVAAGYRFYSYGDAMLIT